MKGVKGGVANVVVGMPLSFRISERTLLGSAAMGRGPERYACLGLARVLAIKQLAKKRRAQRRGSRLSKIPKRVFRPVRLIVFGGSPLIMQTLCVHTLIKGSNPRKADLALSDS